MNLYEYTEQYRRALIALHDMDLDDDVINDTLQGLQGDIEKKGKNIAMFIRNIEADVKAIKEAEKMMGKRRNALETRIKWTKNYLLTNMQIAGISTISCPYFAVTLKKNPPSVTIVEESAIPEKYTTILEMKHIDKKAIADDLKKGNVVEGAALTQELRVDIR